MNRPRTSAVVASAAAFALAGGLYLAPGALAAPSSSSAACADLVNLQVKLSAANDALAALSATAPLADREAATQKVADAELAVKTCEADETEPTTTAPTTQPTTTTAPADDAVDRLLTRIAALRCGASFNRDFGAIRDRQFALISTTSAAEQGRITDALNARLRALGFCGGTVTDPAADDGTTPNTSGEQVIIVPEGSAATGWA